MRVIGSSIMGSILLSFGSVLGLLACGVTNTYVTLPDEEGGADGGTDGGEDAGSDGGDSMEPPCSGQCVPVTKLNWSDPVLLWVGPVADKPSSCPATAPVVGYEGYADLVATNDCPVCTCSTPACVLPAGLVSSTIAMCPNDGPGATLIPFDAPPGWDGSCASPTTIPSNLLASLSILPPTVSACQPGTVPVPTAAPSPFWMTAALVCRGEAQGSCKDAGLTCAPAPEPGDTGFVQCRAYTKDGDAECPPGYPDKRVFYEGYVDNHTCSPCACELPVGSDCVASVSAYQDTACQGSPAPLFEKIPVSLASTNACFSGVMPGALLGSLAAKWVTNKPGTCTPSGGEPGGEVVPTEMTLFCCEATATASD